MQSLGAVLAGTAFFLIATAANAHDQPLPPAPPPAPAPTQQDSGLYFTNNDKQTASSKLWRNFVNYRLRAVSSTSSEPCVSELDAIGMTIIDL